jgi:PhnB protein
MSNTVKPIPDGYHSVTPYLIIPGGKAKEALDFYVRAFGAKELMHMPRPDGKIAHAEMQLGDSKIMLADEPPNMHAPHDHSSVNLHVYLPNVDAAVKQATTVGCTVLRPLTDQFYGDRSAGLKDPFGFHWDLSTHVRDVSAEEMKQHMKTMAA